MKCGSDQRHTTRYERTSKNLDEPRRRNDRVRVSLDLNETQVDDTLRTAYCINTC